MGRQHVPDWQGEEPGYLCEVTGCRRGADWYDETHEEHWDPERPWWVCDYHRRTYSGPELAKVEETAS